jgi:hypothetical protein
VLNDIGSAQSALEEDDYFLGHCATPLFCFSLDP